MAIYSLHLGFISRSEGRSSVGFSAYISASRHQDTRTGAIYSYVVRENVSDSWIMAPESVPDWALHPNTLWNRVEQVEDEQAARRFCCDTPDPQRRLKNEAAKEVFLASAQPAQTIMGALPLELTQTQARALVEEFIQTRFVSRGLIAQCAIHWDKGNPHFHGIITRRPLINGALSQRKDREIVSKPEHNLTRKCWEVVCNKHLALAGREERIDCRSHKDRGLSLIPTIHEGHYAQRLAAEGKYSQLVEKNKNIRERNIEILCEHPETLIRDLSQRRTTFTHKHIEGEIIRRIGGDAHLFAILKTKMDGIEDPNLYTEHENFAADVKAVAKHLTETLISNPDVVHRIGKNPNRETVFTSTVYKDQEEKLVRFSDSLHQKSSKTVTEAQIASAIQTCEQERNITFSDEQQEAVRYLCTGPDIRLLNGRAGTGKTTLLRAVAQTYANAGYNVIGTSFQGKVTETMEKDIGVPCRTLDSLMKYWELHAQKKALVESGKLWGQPYLRAFQNMKELEKYCFTNKDVIIVDEANMIGGRLWEPFLE